MSHLKAQFVWKQNFIVFNPWIANVDLNIEKAAFDHHLPMTKPFIHLKELVTWFKTICFFSSYSVYCALNLSCGSFKIISLVRMVLVLWSNRFAVKTDQTTKLKKMTSLKEENIIIKILNVKIIVSSQTVASILTNELGLKRQPKGDWELIFLQTFRP